MNTSTFNRGYAAVALAALLASAGAFATTMSKAEFGAAKDRIAADYKADKLACEQSSGNAKDICKERASGKEKVARAELDANRSGKASDRNKVAVATADADFATAKEVCDDQSGQTKEVCVTTAKTTHTKALADAKLQRTVGTARRDAAEDKRDADYKLAAEKCDSLAGDAKAACVVEAKSHLGKT